PAEHRVGRHGRGRREHVGRPCRARTARRSTGGGAVPARRAAALRGRPRRGTHRRLPVPLSAVSGPGHYDVAVIGSGYVVVPIAATFAEAGRRVLLVDVQPDVVEALNRGESHIEDVSS